MNQLMSDKGDCRTALAIQGQLITMKPKEVKKMYQFNILVFHNKYDKKKKYRTKFGVGEKFFTQG